MEGYLHMMLKINKEKNRKLENKKSSICKA
jgi:hypothetical protein